MRAVFSAAGQLVQHPAGAKFELQCLRCGQHAPQTSSRCPCSGALETRGFAPTPDRSRWHGRGVWRYRDVLPFEALSPVSLGEGDTPLVEWKDAGILCKLEYVSPTASFKDRGASVVVTHARQVGAKEVVADSSGNAGTALAAYAARAGLKATIFSPSTILPQKAEAIRAFGARLVLTEGGRPGAADAAHAFTSMRGAYFAGHSASPWFVHGIKTIAYEMFEQLGPELCDAVAIPAGHGLGLLGLGLGFEELRRARLIERMPRLIAAQAQGVSPLVDDARGPAQRNSLADGIQIAEPTRLEALRGLLRSTQGTAVAVSAEQTADAWRRLLANGFMVEATSATTLAAVGSLRDEGAIKPEDRVALVLTGRMKSAPALVG